MRINPLLFENGRLRLGSGSHTEVKWHLLYVEDDRYYFLAESYSTEEIKLFQINEKSRGLSVELKYERIYVEGNYSVCYCLDWSPNGHKIITDYADETQIC